MGKTKKLIGAVISDKMQKTCIVRIVRLAKHPKYGKTMRQVAKFKVHDEKGIAKMGDTVSIIETRPLSKDKRFRVAEVVKKAEIMHQLKEETQ